MTEPRKGHAEADRPLARRIGIRLRKERLRAGLTQAKLAEGRYTKAYVSALENGLVKPSMAALNYLAARLGVPVTTLLADEGNLWLRLEADVRLASGDWAEAASMYRALLDSAPDGSGSRAEILRGLAEALCRLDRGSDAIAPASEAGAIFTRLRRPADAALAMYWQAGGHYYAENSHEARALLTDIMRQVREGLDVEPDFPLRVLVLLSMVESRDDEPSQALAYLEEARVASLDLDDRRRATYLFSLAVAYRELADYEGALRTARESLALFRAAQADFETASIDNELALVHLKLGQIEKAREYAADARRHFEALRDHRWLAHVLDTQGQVELASGNPSLARDLAVQASTFARDAENSKAQLSSMLTLGRAEKALGSPEQAAKVMSQAAELARRLDRPRQLEDILVEWSDVLAQLGDLRGAYERSREAATLRLAPGQRHQQPDAVPERSDEGTVAPPQPGMSG
jgi:tetratricopeptide (TPR) repeat protein